MLINEILTEWRESYLYHTTSIPSAVSIWRDDFLSGNTGPTVGHNKFSGVSTTRNYNYALGYLIGNNHDTAGGVIFWINQDLVKRDLGRRRLKGYDWFQDRTPDDTIDDFQFRSELHDTDRFEIVITKGGLKPFRKYVAKIEIWLPEPKNLTPDQQDNSDETMLSNYFRNPLDKKAWKAMLRDPRTDVKKDPGLPKKYQGSTIRRKVQYDIGHPMYRDEY